MMKRVLSFILVLILAMTLPFLGSGVSAQEASIATQADEADLAATVKQQISAFAKSINQSGADSSAAKALAKQGLSGSGKKLSVGKTHALTATLWNSEMFQTATTASCIAAIEHMQMLSMTSLPYLHAGYGWRESNSYYNTFVYAAAEIIPENRELTLIPITKCSQNLNSYDNSLNWIVGDTRVDFSFQQKKITKNEVTYEVKCVVSDRFDFSTSSNSGFKNLISGLGALLFREFDWESKVTFELTVPYSCDHSANNYHWTYDAANRLFIPDTSEGYTENLVTRLTYEEYSGTNRPYYYELDEPVRLYHNQPWVMEYTIRKLSNFVIAPLPSITRLQPCLMNYANSGLLFQKKNIVNNQTMYDCYGTYYNGLLSSKVTYTFRLENEVDAKGNNMVYLTIINADNQATVLSKVPMDDYYENVNGVLSLKDASSSYWNGTDFFISYIGNLAYAFHADYFDLKIWENGIEDGDFFTHKVTKPTCSARGYTTHTCSCCGYSYKDTYTAKTDHKFGLWQQTSAPTCVNNGVETRTCSGCSTAETRAIAATGHSYVSSVVSPTCTEMGYTTHTCRVCKDSYTDTYVNAQGHSYGEWTVSKTPSCTQAGEERRDCANSDHYETRVIPITSHSYQPVVTKPTCTDPGYTTYTCACGERYESDYVTAKGHTEVFNKAVAPTCTATGLTEGKYCDVCKLVLVPQKEIAAFDHNYQPDFTWSEHHTSCTAMLTCARNCGFSQEVACTVSHSDPNHPQTTHTAAAEYHSMTFTDVLVCDNFLIAFENWDHEPISSTYYHAGNAIITPPAPTRPADLTYTYAFTGWDQKVVNCTGNVTYTATYKATYIDYTVIFQYENGTVIQQYTLHYGMPVALPEDPAALGEDLVFAGWDKDVVTCAGDAVYTAKFISKYAPEDFNKDNEINNKDVVYLLWFTLFPENYPVKTDADFTGDGAVNNEDVIHLLWHTLFPESYPLPNKEQSFPN